MRYEDARYWADEFKNWNNYDVPEEWIPAIDNLLDSIFSDNPDARIVQIKEKFGGLRLYMRNLSPEQSLAVHELEGSLYWEPENVWEK